MKQVEKYEYEAPCCQLILLEPGDNMLAKGSKKDGSTKDLYYDEYL